MEIIYGRENLEEVLKVVNSAFCAVREDGFDFIPHQFQYDVFYVYNAVFEHCRNLFGNGIHAVAFKQLFINRDL